MIHAPGTLVKVEMYPPSHKSWVATGRVEGFQVDRFVGAAYLVWVAGLLFVLAPDRIRGAA